MSSARAAKIRDSHFCRVGYRTQIALAPPRLPKARSHFPALQNLPLHPGSARPAPQIRHTRAPPRVSRRAPHRASAPSPNSSLPLRKGDSPIHPSPLEGGRLGGGWESRAATGRATPRSLTPFPLHHPHSPSVTPTPPPLPPLPLRYPHSPSVIPAPPPSFLRRQEPTRRSPPALAPNIRRRGSGQASRQDIAARADTGDRRDSCLRRNDRGSAGVTGLCRNDGSLNSP